MGGVLKSTDGGEKWESKVKVNEKQDISAVDVLSLAISPFDNSVIYIGTMSSGIFITKDAAETWQKLNFPPTKNYSLALNPKDGKTIYAAGVFQDRGKIYKSDNEGTDWKEVYTESSSGAVVTSLAIDKVNPDVLYAGTSAGLVLKTIDGGKSWKNIFSAGGPLTGIEFDASNDYIVYFLVFNQGISLTKAGESFGFQLESRPLYASVNRLIDCLSGTVNDLV